MFSLYAIMEPVVKALSGGSIWGYGDISSEEQFRINGQWKKCAVEKQCVQGGKSSECALRHLVVIHPIISARMTRHVITRDIIKWRHQNSDRSFEYVTYGWWRKNTRFRIYDAIQFDLVYTLLFLPALFSLYCTNQPPTNIYLFILWLTERNAGFLNNFDEDSPMVFPRLCVQLSSNWNNFYWHYCANEWIWIKLL